MPRKCASSQISRKITKTDSHEIMYADTSVMGWCSQIENVCKSRFFNWLIKDNILEIRAGKTILSLGLGLPLIRYRKGLPRVRMTNGIPDAIASTFMARSTTTDATINVLLLVKRYRLTIRNASPPIVEGRKFEANAPAKVIFMASSMGRVTFWARSSTYQRKPLNTIPLNTRARQTGHNQTGKCSKLCQVSIQFCFRMSHINSPDDNSEPMIWIQRPMFFEFFNPLSLSQKPFHTGQ